MAQADSKLFIRKPIFYLSGSAILSFALTVVFMPGAFASGRVFLSGYLWAFSISITQWIGLDFLYQLIDKYISWIEAPVKKVVVQIFSFLAYSASAFTFVQLANYYIWMDCIPADSWSWILKSLPSTLLISFIISLIFTALGFFNAWKQSFIKAEKLKVEMLAYKYESLRNQINPHFLFNSLNVLSDLVYDDQAMAVKFIRQMSDLSRYVLDSRDKELVPLKDELAFIESYTFMLKTRFEEKLTIDIDVQPRPDDYLVPMTLQLLIENAVKHNEVSEAFPLHITVRRNEDSLEVENNLQPKKAGDTSTKTGLKNITQQYAFFSERHIKIISTDEHYTVRVPILKSLEK
jgi:hypothetical protein